MCPREEATPARGRVQGVGAAVDEVAPALELDASPGFATLGRDGLRLLLSAAEGPGGSSQAMPDGRRPRPGGWHRIQLSVDDLAAEVERLRDAGVHMRGDIIGSAHLAAGQCRAV